MYYKSVGSHRCTIYSPENRIPPLRPHAKWTEKFCRKVRIAQMPSRYHPETKYFLKSNHALMAEKYRVLYNTNPLVIHPFSMLTLVRDVLVFFGWVLMYVIFTFWKTFYPYNKLSLHAKITKLIFDIVFIITNFLIGYPQKHDKTIVLDIKMIAKHYLKTYFIFDFLMAIPHPDVYLLFKNPLPYITAIFMFTDTVVGIPRAKTLTRNFNTLLKLLRVKARYHQICLFILLVFLAIHSFTCMIYFMPLIFHSGENRDTIPTSYMNNYKFSSKGVPEKYLLCLHKVMCLVLLTGRGHFRGELVVEKILFTVILVVALWFHIYILVSIIAMVRGTGNSESKNEQLFVHLHNYIKLKQVSPNLRQRIMLYFKSKYQSKYFKENIILAGLSEHLRHEIFLNNSTHVVVNGAFFKGLSRPLIGQIISTLESHLYLPGDVLCKPGDEAGDIYFISYGSIANYTKGGDEVTHFFDGDVLGVLGDNTYDYGLVAIEISEVLVMNKKYVDKFTANSPEFKIKMDAIIANRLKKIEKFLSKFGTLRVDHVLEPLVPRNNND